MSEYEDALVEQLAADPAVALASLRSLGDQVRRLTDERDQALIRAEAAESELEAYRKADKKAS